MSLSIPRPCYGIAGVVLFSTLQGNRGYAAVFKMQNVV